MATASNGRRGRPSDEQIEIVDKVTAEEYEKNPHVKAPAILERLRGLGITIGVVPIQRRLAGHRADERVDAMLAAPASDEITPTLCVETQDDGRMRVWFDMTLQPVYAGMVIERIGGLITSMEVPKS